MSKTQTYDQIVQTSPWAPVGNVPAVQADLEQAGFRTSPEEVARTLARLGFDKSRLPAAAEWYQLQLRVKTIGWVDVGGDSPEIQKVLTELTATKKDLRNHWYRDQILLQRRLRRFGEEWRLRKRENQE